jgi:glycosyltransferase involved in cell wall biosynthesis
LNSILWSGGTDAQCVYLAQGLQALGQNVAMGGPDGRPFALICRDLGLPLHDIPRNGPLKLSFIFRAAQIIRRERIQIVHGHHGRDYWRTIFAARLSGAHPKVVLHRYLAKSFGTWVSQNLLLNRVDAFIAGSHCVAQIMRNGIFEPNSPEPERRARPPVRGDHSRIHVIHGAVDTDKFKPADASKLRQEWKIAPEHVVFAVVAGYPKPRGKGQREFLAAAARLRPEFPNARFLVIGRGDLEQTLREDIARLELSDCAWLTPWCQDMPAVMNAIDCLVHPQIGTDAFPTVILEAMGCAKPVVATAIDGAVEQVLPGQTGLIVPPESVDELAQGLKTILRGGPTLRSRFGESGRARVCSEFRLGRLAERVLELYRKLCRLPQSRGKTGSTAGATARSGESPTCCQPTIPG